MTPRFVGNKVKATVNAGRLSTLPWTATHQDLKACTGYRPDAAIGSIHGLAFMDWDSSEGGSERDCFLLDDEGGGREDEECKVSQS